MQARSRKYVFILVLTLSLAVGVQWLTPEPIDWSWSLERDDTRPYGSAIAFDVLADLFPGAEVVAQDLPPYLVLRDTSVTEVNYLFVSQVFAPDVVEAEKMLAFSARGNAIFIAAARIQGALADTLGLDVHAMAPVTAPGIGESARDSVSLNFVNPTLRTDSAWAFPRGAADRSFSAFDTTRTTVLGGNDADQVNFVRVAVGQGEVFVHLVPLAFTNYHLLEPRGVTYAERALSYLPVRTTWWDSHYKPARSQADTPLRFVLSDPALRWSYYLLLGGVILFVLVEAKRRQRVIPVIAPPRNDSLDFIRTVGRLYHQHGDHVALARKRCTYFLAYVRTRLNLPTHPLDDDLAERIAERSGVERDRVRRLISMIHHAQEQEAISEADLHDLNDQLETFYQRSLR
jgi:hypothetical protein